MSADDARRMGDALGRVVARGHDVTGFFEATGSALRTSIPFDGFCSMTVDPATMLLTSHIAHDSVRPQDVPALGRNEFLEDDVNKFAVLARAPRPAGVLTQATAGQPEASPRFREILRPNGFADELRFTLLDGDKCWGGSRCIGVRAAAGFTTASNAGRRRISAAGRGAATGHPHGGRTGRRGSRRARPHPADSGR